MRFRFTLEKYKGKRTRYTCPKCGASKEFTRYIDAQTGHHLASHVGRCNREVNCGYHYTRKQYFADHNISTCKKEFQPQAKKAKAALPSTRPINFIPFETFCNSLSGYEGNNLVRYLQRLFDTATVGELIKRFYIGTSSYWNGATVFWQIDVRGRVRTGKIMLYDSLTGKRVKKVMADGSRRSQITWAHSLLQKQSVVQDYNLRQCLFGEHQLVGQRASRPVAIVESEKTAIIASAYLRDFVWLACGSLTNLTADKCRVLSGRKVVLFPDLNCLEKWRDQAKRLQAVLDCHISVSDLLERKAGESDRAQGLDLADYLVKYQLTDNGLPDEIYIPASVPNTIEAITRCIEAQRRKKVA